MSSALQRWKAVPLGCLVGGVTAVVLAGMLSLLRPELVFAGFTMGAALGGAVAGYFGQRLPLAQGALVGLATGLIELAFLLLNGTGLLPEWGLASLVAINGVAGMLGARMSSVRRLATAGLGEAEPAPQRTPDPAHDEPAAQPDQVSR